MNFHYSIKNWKYQEAYQAKLNEELILNEDHIVDDSLQFKKFIAV